MTLRDHFDRATSGCLFAATGLLLTAAPWLFGAWEMWWFWPLTGLLFGVVLLFAVRLVFLGCGYPPRSRHNRRLALILLWGWLPFLLYALIRFRQAEVLLDAERSLLLFVTPVLLGIVIVFGFSRRQLKGLFIILLINLLALGIYGIVNWYVTRGEFVMWQPGYPQYILEERASGSYYCPNHFAGVMAIAFCAGLAVLLTRNGQTWLKALALSLLTAAAWSILLTKSRGAAISLAAVAILFLAIGFLQWRPMVRYLLALFLAVLTVAGAVAMVRNDVPFVQRFRRYPWQRIEQSCRYQMISGALRAWRSAPFLGIGPGMHRHLWPHFAASTDGDRATARWPRSPNDTFHSYEVHSDWVQLMEEYGIAGLALFLWAAIATLALPVAALRREWRRQRAAAWRASGHFEYATVMTGLLAATTMIVHSLGDFNLQMPATTWLLGALTAIPLGFILRDPEFPAHEGNAAPDPLP